MRKNHHYCNCSVCHLTSNPHYSLLASILEHACVGIALAALVFSGMSATIGTPRELLLEAENEQLAAQLSRVQEQSVQISDELDRLAEQQQYVFEAFRQISSLPVKYELKDGELVHAAYGRMSAEHAQTRTGQSALAALDQLERQVLQHQTRSRHRLSWLYQQPITRPAKGPIASGFGMRYHPVLKKQHMHEGIDIALPVGSPVVASGSGVVMRADTHRTYGKHVRIKHPVSGFLTVYAHLSSISSHIRPGVRVDGGEVIGRSGTSGRATGPHLHYEIHRLKSGPIDPAQFPMPRSSSEREPLRVAVHGDSTRSLFSIRTANLMLESSGYLNGTFEQ